MRYEWRTVALVRHNVIMLMREPGPLASRVIQPLLIATLLHPLYQGVQGRVAGTRQDMFGVLVIFSLLALSIVSSSLLTERLWHTWQRLRATPAHPAELLLGKAIPVMGVLLLQQSVIIGFGIVVFGMRIASPALLVLALLSWTLALLAMGAVLGLVARSYGELSASYDIGGMALGCLGGALVPLADLPHWVRVFAPVSPGYWAMEALRAATQGQAVTTVTASAVLGAFTVAGCVIAALRFRIGWSRSASM
jgi:ABC-2 type transport system permease protein